MSPIDRLPVMPTTLFSIKNAGAVSIVDITGASFTGAISNVIVFGIGSRSTPPLLTPPSSRTWKVKLSTLTPLTS